MNSEKKEVNLLIDKLINIINKYVKENNIDLTSYIITNPKRLKTKDSIIYFTYKDDIIKMKKCYFNGLDTKNNNIIWLIDKFSKKFWKINYILTEVLIFKKKPKIKIISDTVLECFKIINPDIYNKINKLEFNKKLYNNMLNKSFMISSDKINKPEIPKITENKKNINKLNNNQLTNYNELNNNQPTNYNKLNNNQPTNYNKLNNNQPINYNNQPTNYNEFKKYAINPLQNLNNQNSSGYNFKTNY